jgi:hypothetical protein
MSTLRFAADLVGRGFLADYAPQRVLQAFAPDRKLQRLVDQRLILACSRARLRIPRPRCRDTW